LARPASVPIVVGLEGRAAAEGGVMTDALQLQLDDGTTFEAILEGELTDEDVLRSLGKLRIVAQDDDVEGHAATSTLGVIVYGPDDVEGHALTLRLPHAQATRDLQRKLLAAGIAGVVIVGAATTSMWAPSSASTTAGTTTSAVTSEAAPPNRALLAEQHDGLLAAEAAAAQAQAAREAPPNRALLAEQHDGLLAAEAAAAEQAAQPAPLHRGMQPK
jgi:hypothetical protein